MSESNIFIEVILLKNIFEQLKDNSLCVVHGGAWHCNQVEKILLQEGFERDEECSINPPGLKIGVKMEDPMNMPYSLDYKFMNEKSWKFINEKSGLNGVKSDSRLE